MGHPILMGRTQNVKQHKKRRIAVAWGVSIPVGKGTDVSHEWSVPGCEGTIPTIDADAPSEISAD